MTLVITIALKFDMRHLTIVTNTIKHYREVSSTLDRDRKAEYHKAMDAYFERLCLQYEVFETPSDLTDEVKSFDDMPYMYKMLQNQTEVYLCTNEPYFFIFYDRELGSGYFKDTM